MNAKATELFQHLMDELNVAVRKKNPAAEIHGNHSMPMVLAFAEQHGVHLIVRDPEDVAANVNQWYVNLKTWQDYTKLLVFHWVNATEEKNNWQERTHYLRQAGLTYNSFGIWLVKRRPPTFASLCCLAELEGFELKWKPVK